MRSIIKKYNTIETLLLSSHKHGLVVFFPSAGTVIDDYRPTLKSISNYKDVLFVKRGYYGLSKRDKENKVASTSEFASNFYKGYKKIIDVYDDITIVAQSFGTIHGLQLKKLIKRARLILVSPTLTESRFLFSPVDRIVFSFLINTKVGRQVLMFSQLPMIERVGKKFIQHFVPEIQRPIKRAGLISYLTCLYEITCSGVVKPGEIDKDTLVIVGKHDNFINRICFQQKLRRRANTIMVEANHSVLQNNWKEVVPLITAL